MSENNPTVGVAVDRARPAGAEFARDAHGRRWTFGPWLVAVSLLFLQSGLFLAFAAGDLELTGYIELHLGLCATMVAAGLCWIRILTADEDRNGWTAIVLQLGAWTALAGPFGALMAMALVAPRNADATGDLAPATPEAGPELTRLELLHGSLLDSRLRLEDAHPIQPLLDVILDGTQIEKLDALSLISKHYAPALAPALQRALEDRDGSVRVLAATVMARQHNAYTKRIGALQVIAKASPECLDHWVELGRARLDYAQSGLLEASRADAEATRARADLTRAKQLDPDDTVTQVRLDAAAEPLPPVGSHHTPCPHDR
jgi:hypothetical protein